MKKASSPPIACAALVLALMAHVTTAEAQRPANRTLASTETEACGHDELKVVGIGPDGKDVEIHIPSARASEKPIAVRNPEVTWHCGASKERTRCPDGTAVVTVQRTRERRFYLYCWR